MISLCYLLCRAQSTVLATDLPGIIFKIPAYELFFKGIYQNGLSCCRGAGGGMTQPFNNLTNFRHSGK